MQTKRGITGLSQKEAVFQIIKQALGDQFQEGMDVKSTICLSSRLNYGEMRTRSPLLFKIIHNVSAAIIDRTIRSKWNPDKELHSYSIEKIEIDRYANRIVHYWLKHDKRLNGGQIGARITKQKRQQIVIEGRLKSDPSLISLKKLKDTLSSQVELLEVESFIVGRITAIVFEVLEVDTSPLSSEIKTKLKIDPSVWEIQEKKAG